MRLATMLEQRRIPPAHADRIEQVLRFQSIADLLRQEETREGQIRSPRGQEHALRHRGPFDQTHPRDKAGRGDEEAGDDEELVRHLPVQVLPLDRVRPVSHELREVERADGEEGVADGDEPLAAEGHLLVLGPAPEPHHRQGEGDEDRGPHEDLVRQRPRGSCDDPLHMLRPVFLGELVPEPRVALVANRLREAETARHDPEHRQGQCAAPLLTDLDGDEAA